MSDHLVEVAWYWFAGFVLFSALAVALLRNFDR